MTRESRTNPLEGVLIYSDEVLVHHPTSRLRQFQKSTALSIADQRKNASLFESLVVHLVVLCQYESHSPWEVHLRFSDGAIFLVVSLDGKRERISEKRMIPRIYTSVGIQRHQYLHVFQEQGAKETL